jgi:hypothetical protein
LANCTAAKRVYETRWGFEVKEQGYCGWAASRDDWHELNGRDTKGYAGIIWAIVGKKFDLKRYIDYVCMGRLMRLM